MRKKQTGNKTIAVTNSKGLVLQVSCERCGEKAYVTRLEGDEPFYCTECALIMDYIREQQSKYLIAIKQLESIDVDIFSTEIKDSERKFLKKVIKFISQYLKDLSEELENDK